MFTLTGKYNTAKVFTDIIDNETISQILNLLNQEFVKDSKIRIMPDTHAGAGSTIGTTMTITDKVVPNLTGVDIGCGMLTIELDRKVKDLDLPKLDSVIRAHVPSGFQVHDTQQHETSLDCTKLRCWHKKNAKINDLLAYRSVGTLGGGNHFIELDADDYNNVYLIIHTGSRHLGLEVANYYQNLAYEHLQKDNLPNQKTELIQKLKSKGRQCEIESTIKTLTDEYHKKHPAIPKDLAYLTGEDLDDYLHDISLVQKHASCNREAIAKTILKHMGWFSLNQFETIHNYIDTKYRILRKGAVSARENQRALIPINMRDGSLLCIGKGNDDWNQSAPHGAGRIMSRSQAKETIRLKDYKDTMQSVWTTSVNQSTIDESPFAYKPMQSIIENIQDTVEIEKILKPVYNFKASNA